jgi:pimeloyl-ACP methyl ester carboxylesterase
MNIKSFTPIFLLTFLFLNNSCSEEFESSSATNDFFHLKYEGYYMPVLVRGNTASRKILLFVQGGPAINTIDFADVDYPRWKNSLEKKFAIAYYEPRGMGNRQGNFNLEEISIDQYLDDLHQVAKSVRHQYDAEVYLLGHSFGGYLTYRYMIKYGNDDVVAKYITANGPATTDYDTAARWDFRRQFLMNEATEAIAGGMDLVKWEEILQWCIGHPVLDADDEFTQWNAYVEENIYINYEEELPTTADYLNVAFFSSYNPLTTSLNMNVASTVENKLEEGLRAFPLIKNLVLLEKPLLMITGRHDDVCPPEEAQHIYENISSAEKRIVILPDAGHHTFHGQPELFNEAIEEFIK